MKTEYLLLGIFLLVIGGGIAFLGYTTIREYQTFLGQLARSLFSSEQQRYQMGILITLGGGVLSLIGLGAIIYGGLSKREGISEEVEQITKEAERNFNLYFKYCPLCCAEGSVKPRWSFGGKDYAICSECGAKWHLYVGLTGFKWAKLENVNISGKGTELLNKEYNPEYWQRLALMGRKTTTTPSKIYCSQCGTENLQDSIYCIKCGNKIGGS
jgi:hypothetical protein